MLELFILLIFGHAIADYALQSEGMALCKNPNLKKMWEDAEKYPGITDYLQPRVINQAFVPWYYFMGAHGMINGFFVYLFTGSVYLGVAEAFCHSVIDLGKCHKVYGIHIDQALHVVCKLAWVLVLFL